MGHDIDSYPESPDAPVSPALLNYERTENNFSEFFEPADTLASVSAAEVTLDVEDWSELYEAGIDYVEAARVVFSELADASDAEVDMALAEMVDGMSEAEMAEFFKKLARAAKRAVKTVARVAAPALKVVAPLAGTVLGGPLGGVVGGLVGKLGAGALSHVGRRRSRRRVRRVRRGVPRHSRSRGRSASALLRLIRDPRLQQMLLGMLRGESVLHGKTGESMSAPAVLVGLHGAIVETLAEMQAAGLDIDHSPDGYAPVDFESARDAFETLMAVVDDPEA